MLEGLKIGNIGTISSLTPTIGPKPSVIVSSDVTDADREVGGVKSASGFRKRWSVNFLNDEDFDVQIFGSFNKLGIEDLCLSFI